MRRAPAIAIFLAACAAGRPARGPAAPAYVATHPIVGGSNEACEGCHATIASEWRASLHAQSASDPVYRRSFAREPLEFCTSCHAPEATAAPSPEAVAIGVGCVSCHATVGTAMRTRSCDGCHEFPFPDGTGKMQLTVTEHRASVHRDTACVTCHMPRLESHVDHRFAASRDPGMLQRAAWISAVRRPDAIVVRFVPRDVGHALPTGDIFRRLRVVVTAGDAHAETTMSRKSKGGDGADDRAFVEGGPTEVRVPIVAPGEAIAWRVVYERVEHPRSLDESDAVVEGSIVLASGALPSPADYRRRAVVP